MSPKKTKPNEKCPCRSGKKYKKCCMIANQVMATSTTAASSSSSPAALLNEVMAELAVTITTASATDMSACSHGSTSTHFSDGRAYSDVVRELLSLSDQAGREQFEQEHRDYFRDLDFTQYLFAFCTSWYLKLNQTTRKMKWILYWAVYIKYSGDGSAPDHDKLTRYSRAIWNNDDRGVINCLSKETKSYCNCMKDKKTEADGMEKTDKCYGCKHSFPRSDMKKCSGCQFAMFCTTEGCYDEHWPKHRKGCQELQKQQALIDDLEEKQQALLHGREDSHK